jgi:hypothetical protein
MLSQDQEKLALEFTIQEVDMRGRGSILLPPPLSFP